MTKMQSKPVQSKAADSAASGIAAVVAAAEGNAMFDHLPQVPAETRTAATAEFKALFVRLLNEATIDERRVLDIAIRFHNRVYWAIGHKTYGRTLAALDRKVVAPMPQEIQDAIERMPEALRDTFVASYEAARRKAARSANAKVAQGALRS